MKTPKSPLVKAALGLTLCLPIVASSPMLLASSHMDAPLVTLDPAANTTDVYAFLTSRGGTKYLQVALAVYPHEEPGIGPNKYNFDDNVLYQIFLSSGSDLPAGRDTVAYQFRFTSAYKNQDTILQSYLGVVATVGDASQNFTQTYTVTKVVGSITTVLGTGTVPPNNQGIATPKYNVADSGDNRARPGVATAGALDAYTTQSIASLTGGYRVFAGQREDGFYGDINAIFDLLSLRTGSGNSFDSQGGYNTHVITLEIPVADIGGDQQVVGVYATTSRRAMQVLSTTQAPDLQGAWVQVGRQGNPLFNEALVGIRDKDLYNRTKPDTDAALFTKYAQTPELAALINAIVFGGQAVAPTTNRSDLVGIFIPDVIKVDLSTGPARLAGGGAVYPGNADDAGYSRLSVFGGDALTSSVQAGFPGFPAGTVAGGWPNGRRFGDDVVDIAVTAVISDLRTNPLTIRSAAGIDNVNANDAVYSKVFPYASTPFNGRNYAKSPASPQAPLVNLAARGQVGVGNNVLIGGLIIRGSVPQKVLVRAQGPNLANFGITNALADPTIELYSGTTVVGSNDNWKSSQQTEITATGLAPANDAEAAIVVTLPPGAYTMVVRGKNDGTGVGLVETFLVD